MDSHDNISTEVEIRAAIRALDLNDAVSRLTACGFEEIGRSVQIDSIFDRPDGSLFRSGSKIRIRQEGESVELTHKSSMAARSDVSIRTETTVGMSTAQVEDMGEFLAAIGYPLLYRFPKERAHLRRGPADASVDRWPIVGVVVELEGSSVDIHRAAAEAFDGLEFRNFRLKELMLAAVDFSGRSFAELQAEAESEWGMPFGNLAHIL